MKTIGELQLLPVWVNPNHRVATAKILLSGHRLRALGIIEGGQLIGTIGFEELSVACDSDEVGRFARPLTRMVSPDDPTRSVADIMAADDLDCLPVVDRGRFLGIVTATMLLSELGRSWDPLTGLTWSDGLREWGIQQLRDGREVTILFIDLDDFGQYNKKFGHIVGDRVLVKVAHYLRSAVDPSQDVLVRYGGDEFAIATVRSRADTEDLLRNLERGLQGTLVADSDQPITFSAGIFGGRRTKERENVHFSATLDTMINMASKGAMAAKVAKKEGQSAPAASAEVEVAPIAVVEVFFSGDTPSALSTVILSQKDRVASGVHTRGELTKTQSVVHAALKALERLVETRRFEIENVQLSENDSGDRFVTVSGHVIEGESTQPTSSSKPVGTDVYRATAEAAVEAFLG